MPIFSLTAKQLEIRKLLSSPATHCLVYGGSRSGKTFLLCYAVIIRALKAAGSRHAIFRRSRNAARVSIWQDTLPRVFKLAHPDLGVRKNEQDMFLTLPNGSEIWVAGLDDKDRVEKVLGREFATIYYNEASQISYDTFALTRTRLAQKCTDVAGRGLPLKSYVDLNPTTRTHWTHRMWIDGINPVDQRALNMTNYVHAVANPLDNAANFAPEYIRELEDLPERQRRRFLLGEYASDVEGALWRRELIRRVQSAPDLARVVVAIDPAVSTEAGSDETGIVVVGAGADQQGYVLADESGKHTPTEWARRAIALYREFDADRVVAEINQGGDLVESVLRSQSANIPYRGVRATRGKALRAEPVSALYERGKIYHVGEFAELEDQMCSWIADFDRRAQGYSPDRLDALVWGLTDLFPAITRRETPPIDFTAAPAGGENSWMGM